MKKLFFGYVKLGLKIMNLCESVESVGVFLCPTDFTDLHRFFMPRVSSFCLNLSAVV